MAKLVDARGLGCPQPVILTRKALEAEDAITVIVDNSTARENVSRMAGSMGCSVTVEDASDGIHVQIKKTDAGPTDSKKASETGKTPEIVGTDGPLVVVIQENIMGRGSAQLGDLLMKSFLHTLGEVSPVPDVIIFYNAGIKLAVKGSEVVEDLKALEKRGVKLLVCGTCLNYFELTDDLQAGMVSNMYDIAETLLTAGKVVSV